MTFSIAILTKAAEVVDVTLKSGFFSLTQSSYLFRVFACTHCMVFMYQCQVYFRIFFGVSNRAILTLHSQLFTLHRRRGHYCCLQELHPACGAVGADKRVPSHSPRGEICPGRPEPGATDWGIGKHRAIVTSTPSGSLLKGNLCHVCFEEVMKNFA